MFQSVSCLTLFSVPVVGGGRGQLHSLRQLVWWRSDRLLAVGHNEGGMDTLIEFSMKLDKEKHSLEIRQWYALIHNIICTWVGRVPTGRKSF